MTKFIPSLHPAEDVFENYAFNRLTDYETANFEEHLLICETCQSTLEQTDAFVRLMKTAAAAYVVEHSRTSPTKLGTRSRGSRGNMPAAAVLAFSCMTALSSWKIAGGEQRSIRPTEHQSANLELLPDPSFDA